VVANDAVNDELNDAWYQNQVLVDDLTGAIVSELKSQPDDMEKRVLDYINEGKTHWQDTHPCDRERIENAHKEQDAGVFQMTLPASSLINKFEKLSKELTFLQYRNIWGVPVTKKQLIPVSKFEGDRQAKQESYAALDRYFASFFTVYSPTTLKYPVEVSESQRDKYLDEWRKAVTLQRGQIQIQQQYDHTGRLFERWGDAERADALIKGGFNIDAKEFGLASNDSARVAQVLESVKGEYARALDDVLKYCKIVFHRMQMSLVLSMLPGMDKSQLDQIATPDMLTKITRCLDRINRVLVESRQLHFNNMRLGILLYNWQQDEEQNPKGLRECIEQAAEICRRHITVMQDSLANMPYPFEHAKDNFSLVEHIFGQDVKDMSPPQIEGYSEHVLGNLHSLQWRMVSLLCRYAGQVELLSGLAEPEKGSE